MADVDIDSLHRPGHFIESPEMKSDLEATAHPPEQPICNNGRLITKRLNDVKRDDDSTRSIKQLFLDNQAGICLNLIMLLYWCQLLIPKSRPFTNLCLWLSYYNPSTDKYGVGFKDIMYVMYYLVLFTGLRDGLMKGVLAPLGRRWGIKSAKDVDRFAEQTWMICYYCFFWPLGVYIWYSSPYFLNMAELWTDWPSREIAGVMKFYFLAQLAFWIQQIYVINIEKQRKDYWQMLSHHVVTIGLVAASYAYHFTRVGNLILIIMDVVDIVFPLAKCAKYLGFNTLCDVLFGLFVVVWLATRHVFFLMVIYSVYFDVPGVVPEACFQGNMNNLQGPLPQPDGWSWLLQPFIQPEGLICFNQSIFNGFFIYLVALQGIMVMWSYAILKVTVKVLSGHNAEDIRSDDEGEEEVGDEEKEEEQGLLEEEADADDGIVKAWQRRNRIVLKRGASSSALYLPGHRDRKEFLNRIGCEKQIE